MAAPGLINIKKYANNGHVPGGTVDKNHLPMQGTWVWSLVQEDSTFRGATKPVCYSYWAHTLEPVLHNKRSHRNEKPKHHLNKE